MRGEARRGNKRRRAHSTVLAAPCGAGKRRRRAGHASEAAVLTHPDPLAGAGLGWAGLAAVRGAGKRPSSPCACASPVLAGPAVSHLGALAASHTLPRAPHAAICQLRRRTPPPRTCWSLAFCRPVGKGEKGEGVRGGRGGCTDENRRAHLDGAPGALGCILRRHALAHGWRTGAPSALRWAK